MATDTTTIPPQLKAGGVLKFSPHTQRFFIIQHSREIPVDQAQARRLAYAADAIKELHIPREG